MFLERIDKNEEEDEKMRSMKMSNGPFGALSIHFGVCGINLGSNGQTDFKNPVHYPISRPQVGHRTQGHNSTQEISSHRYRE